MVNLNDFRLFVQIVEHGGFAAAGRILNMSKSTLSHRMLALEKALDARLINRTTRRFGLTDVGETFFAEARAMVRNADAAEASVRSRAIEPSGLVRYTVAVSEAQFVLRPALSDFLGRYPKVNLFEHATDREVDIFAEGFDLAIRAHPGPLKDSRLIQRVLGVADWHIFASPKCLANSGPISSPADLSDCPALFTRRAQANGAWHLKPEDGGDEHRIAVPPRIVSDSMVGLKEMAKIGFGLVALPAYVSRDEVARGELVRVLPGWVAGQSTLSALIPERRGLLPAVRVFLDHLADVVPDAIRP